MNYQTVLQNYHPTEQGDFMLKYEIDGRGYVIYSPEKDSWSCIELHSFSELTPWQLAFVLSLDMRQMSFLSLYVASGKSFCPISSMWRKAKPS